MTRKRRNSVPALSLFPFLAVLLCTMGILVVFLFASVRIAGDQAKLVNSEVVQKNELQIRQLQADQQLAEIRIDGWREQRDQRNTELQTQRVRHAQLLYQIDEIRQESQRMGASFQELAQQKKSGETDSAAELNSIREQAGLVASRLDSVQKELSIAKPAGRESMYSLVPWSGTGGTSRRPIYVECTRDAVILQPSGIRLGPDDFSEPDMPGNPLDAALGGIREYWLRNQVAGENGKPYPLLVVRPDGSASYAIARRAMKNWNDEFGYELIAKDLELDFGDSDPELEKELDETLKRSRELMAMWHARMEQQRQAEQRMQQASRQHVSTEGMRASRSGGGFVNQGGSAFGDPSEKGSAKSTSREYVSSSRELATAAAQQTSASPSSSESRYVRSDVAANGAQANSGNAGENPAGPGGQSEVPNSNSEPASEGGGSSAEKTGEVQNSASAATCACAADKHGEGWAVSRTQNQRTAYVRPIIVWCDSEKILVDTGASSWLNVPDVRFEQNDITTAENLAIAVKQVTDSWGTPPEFGYWRPQLRVRVMAGGEYRADQIDQLMDRSGILISEATGK